MLSLFANPLNTRILRAHAEGSRRLAELCEEFDWTPEATVRAAVKGLTESGALEKRRAENGRRGVSTSLTPAGEELLSVAGELEAWLAACPLGRIDLEDDSAKVAVRALADGWSSTLLRELARGPCTLNELVWRIDELTHSAIERRLAWMRQTGQIAPQGRRQRSTSYAPTDWLRRSLGPLCSAGRCEARHFDDAPPVTEVEVEAAFLLALPLVRLAKGRGGQCLLAVLTDDPPSNGQPAVAGVAVDVVRGNVSAKPADFGSDPASWALGPAGDWIDAVIDCRMEGLRPGGADPQLPLDLINALHHALYIDR